MDINQASQTDWNGGTLTNIRLHSIRDQIKICVMVNDLYGWLSLLVQMNHELYGFQTPEEKTKLRTNLKELAEKINKHKQINSRTKNRVTGIPADIIDSLNEMQYVLDEVFHKSGLQTALREDSGDVF